MRQTESPLSRRTFLHRSAQSIGALSALSAAPAAGYHKLYLPPSSPLPVKTAAAELTVHTGATVIPERHTGSVKPGEIILALGDEISRYPPAAAMLPDSVRAKEWEINKPVDAGLVFAASSPRNLCHAALAWIANPAGETGRLSTYRFTERFTMWDNALNQMFRFSEGFDRRRHIREIARLGHTGVELNRYADAGFWVNHRKFKDDSYAWYMSYAPALDAFVESSLTRGIYPREELEANLADLREAVQIAREYGLDPGFVCYEPRGVSEAVFDRHPGLRGSRIDHPGRSLEPRYALDIAHPRVLEHYAEMLTNLMEEVPDLRYFAFWTQDSGSGIPFTRGLYAGPNGSYRARASTVGKMVADFTGTLLNAGRKIRPDFEVIMEIGWEYRTGERREITNALPDGVTLSHTIGGNTFRGGGLADREAYLADDRAAGVTPYAAIVVTSMFDQAPLIGLNSAPMLARTIAAVDQAGLRRLFTLGGIVAPPQSPYNASQELYAELIRREVPNLDDFLLATASRWCDGDDAAAAALLEAWNSGAEALARWPVLAWYDRGSAQTQSRWITRPLVPDVTRLTDQENAAWQRVLFPVPWDIQRKNISFEGGIRMYENDNLDDAVRRYDQEFFPAMERTIAILDTAIKSSPKPVLIDQRDRYLGFLLCCRSVRNLFDAQVAINRYVVKDAGADANRDRMRGAILAEIGNTQLWLRLLRGSKITFFRTAERETPFLYRSPIEDLEVKLRAMKAHIDDEPGPYLKELTESHSEANLLFFEEPGAE